MTYNVCWGCMENDSRDKTASELAKRCERDACLRQVAANIDRAGEASLQEQCGPLLAVGLQEASRHEVLQQQSRVLRDMQVSSHTEGREHLALFLCDALHIAWSGVGHVSKRPLQVVLAQGGGDRTFLFVHFHNNHHQKGTRECIQKGVAGVRPQAPHVEDWHSVLSDLPSDAVVIAMGDWNEFIDGSLRPFALCAQAPQRVQEMRLTYSNNPPLSCCSVRRDFTRAHPADYVLSNRQVLNRLAPLASAGDASDHLPVIGTIDTDVIVERLPTAASPTRRASAGDKSRTPLRRWLLAGMPGAAALAIYLWSLRRSPGGVAQSA